MSNSADTYAQLYRETVGKRYWGVKKHAKRFIQLDRELRGRDIDPESYVQVSHLIWKDFITEKGMDILPLNILMSQKAIERYEELDPVSDQDFVLGLLRYFEEGAVIIRVQGLVGSRQDAAEDLQDFLPDNYDDMVKQYPGQWAEVSQAALESTAKRYRVEPEFMDVESIAQAIIQTGRKV